MVLAGSPPPIHHQFENLTKKREEVILEAFSLERGYQPVKCRIGTGPPEKEAAAHRMWKPLPGLGKWRVGCDPVK